MRANLSRGRRVAVDRRTHGRLLFRDILKASLFPATEDCKRWAIPDSSRSGCLCKAPSVDRLSIATALVGAEGKKSNDHEAQGESDDESENEGAHTTRAHVRSHRRR